jgi:hypothetical protein
VRSGRRVEPGNVDKHPKSRHHSTFNEPGSRQDVLQAVVGFASVERGYYLFMDPKVMAIEKKLGLDLRYLPSNRRYDLAHTARSPHTPARQ